MKSSFARGLSAWFLSLCLISLGLPHAALAGSVDPQTFLSTQSEQQPAASVQEWLAREEVGQQMLQLGVDPAQVQQRVAALTPEQLQQLEGRLQELPAGGSILAVVGAVFVVLLILDMVGVTNVFSRV